MNNKWLLISQLLLNNLNIQLFLILAVFYAVKKKNTD